MVIMQTDLAVTVMSENKIFISNVNNSREIVCEAFYSAGSDKISSQINAYSYYHD